MQMNIKCPRSFVAINSKAVFFVAVFLVFVLFSMKCYFCSRFIAFSHYLATSGSGLFFCVCCLS